MSFYEKLSFHEGERQFKSISRIRFSEFDLVFTIVKDNLESALNPRVEYDWDCNKQRPNPPNLLTPKELLLLFFYFISGSGEGIISMTNLARIHGVSRSSICNYISHFVWAVFSSLKI